MTSLGSATERWSCGGSKHIRVGDRAFLIRLGVEPKGIMGAGTVIRERYDFPHYDPERAARGDLIGRIDVQFDTLLDPDSQALLPREFLRTTAPFSAMHWDTQMSGVRIPDHIAAALEAEWARLATPHLLPLAEELPTGTTYREGAARQILVNAYERNAAARQRCLAHHGARCAVFHRIPRARLHRRLHRGGDAVCSHGAPDHRSRPFRPSGVACWRS